MTARAFLFLPVLFSLISPAFFSGCGYRFEGGGYLADTIDAVSVRVFENRTGEPGAGVLFTNHLVEEITGKTSSTVVDPSRARAFIKGTVRSITFRTLSRSSAENVIERRVKAIVDIEIVNRSGETIWSVTGHDTHHDYLVSSDKAADEDNKKQAVEMIAQRSAEKLVSGMTDNF